MPPTSTEIQLLTGGQELYAIEVLVKDKETVSDPTKTIVNIELADDDRTLPA